MNIEISDSELQLLINALEADICEYGQTKEECDLLRKLSDYVCED